MKKFKFIDLFAGIGGLRIAFESQGGECVFSSEWDKDAAKTYEANFGEKPYGDITEIEENDIPNFDILLAGFPCQPFSIIGDKEGFEHETQGTLFFDVERIIKAKRPKAFLLENVRNLKTHDKGRTFETIVEHLEKLGYDIHHDILNALDYGVPQRRQRIVIVGFDKVRNFEFPKPIPIEERKTLSDILENSSSVDKKYFVKDEIKERRMNKMKEEISKPYITHENVGGSVTPHHYSCALRAGASSNYLLVNNERRLTERELLRLQGFPEDFKIVVSYTAIRKQTGNSVCVPQFVEVAKKIIETMGEDLENA